MRNRYLIEVKTGQQFEYSKGGVRQDRTWMFVHPMFGTKAPAPMPKHVSFHLSNWGEYKEGTFDRLPSQQEAMLARLKELRRKPKIFKWVDYDGEVQGFFKLTSWRKNRWDLVVEGRLLENNLEVLELLEEKK